MSERDTLIALQELDSAIDQLGHRLERLPERSALDEADRALGELRAERDASAIELSEAEDALARTELETAELDSHRHRLDAQMKTIISPREAEALQREMGVLADRRGALDDQGLILLETMSDADSRIASADAEEPGLAGARDRAAVALAAAESEIQAEIEVFREQRGAASADLPPATLRRYESMRGTHAGVAVARLIGTQCTGCHIEMSVGEAEAVRHVPADEIPECPNCGRLLVP